MELSEMTFPQVLALDIFRDALTQQMARELGALKEAEKHGKVARMAMTSLVERGKFTAEEMTAAYYHIIHKEATEYSANERKYITDVCTIAYTKTIRTLQEESEENSRNPLLRWVRQFHAWIVSKCRKQKS
jgi:polyhydroxyalkanoate synthesis regulator phasin